MNLIPTMIVEDENLLLEDLVTIIDWEAAGFKIVATAINGEQGRRKFSQYKPQLILTDIKMPVMDGLSMMRSIRQVAPSTSFIIISSYSDFEYAQTALRLGASDYILKTSITPEYILKKLNHIRETFSTSQEVYASAFKKMLEDLIHSGLAIEPSAVETLMSSLSGANIEQHLNQYATSAVAVFAAAIDQFKLNLSVDTPPVRSIRDFKTWLFRELSNIQKNRLQYVEKQLSPVVINAYNYIRNNFSNPDLKILDISNAVGISSSRLSVLFKNELGKTVNEVLTEVRIEEAKYLLRWQQLKVYEVSSRVGYKTSQYFSKIFYQYTGQSPNIYREPILTR